MKHKLPVKNKLWTPWAVVFLHYLPHPVKDSKHCRRPQICVAT